MLYILVTIKGPAILPRDPKKENVPLKGPVKMSKEERSFIPLQFKPELQKHFLYLFFFFI